MHLTQILAILGATLTAAQSDEQQRTQLHIGTIEGCGTNMRGPNWFVWFDNQSPCSGIDLGLVNSYTDYGLCDVTAQIPGQPQVTFEGCARRPDIMSHAGPPAVAMLQNGPVLACRAVNEENFVCPSPCDSNAMVTVTRNYICAEMGGQ
ncbi:uncharacterized protein BO80DRAFT_470818 [Aspergillus ibericus CBS 121593]|uniref:Ig-like domain-containing protein n=1 Tax=Aspergillus ibericus CBS 121593 TaxID=1448316 RepID=A0A395H5K5_9EURO|nr:hypothetical protein BO80DRAFT_470818 [Aspergillus ibericus CBS 121593]RAL03162.1 hypothetical protein BO80DRAFT_470818 [Aspergillus ibericus CBS 121593]